MPGRGDCSLASFPAGAEHKGIRMNRKRRLYTAAMIVVLSLSTSIGQGRRSYEVETQVYSVPGYQSDASRAITAYERLMERHMDLTERTLNAIAVDMQAIAARLEAVDAGMTQLDLRLARIERHLGIVPPSVSSGLDPNAPPASVAPGDSPSAGRPL